MAGQRPTLGVVLFDDPTNPLRGWLSLEGEPAKRIQNYGEISTNVVCLSNLYHSQWTPRILDEKFLGMGGLLKLFSEIGIPCTRYTKFISENRKMEIVQPVDAISAAEIISQWFCAFWDRILDFSEPMDKNIKQGVVLMDESGMVLNLPQALSRAIIPQNWNALHADCPKTLTMQGAQDRVLEYWINRPVARGKGVQDRVLRFSRMSYAAEIFLHFFLPIPPWKSIRGFWPRDLSPSVGIFHGEIENIPEEWATWWIPGTGGIQKRIGKALRNRWSGNEWLFAQSIGAKTLENGDSYYSAGLVHFLEIFPAMEVFRQRLNPLSWIDQQIAGILPKVLETPINSIGDLSPSRVFLRGITLLMDMNLSRTLYKTARSQGFNIEVMGYGSGKCHITHALSEEEWKQFSLLAASMGWIIPPTIVKRDNYE